MIKNKETQSRLFDEIMELLPCCTLKDRRDIEPLIKSIRVKQEKDLGLMRKLKERASVSAMIVEKRLRSATGFTIDSRLPISFKKNDILETIRNHSVVIVTGETGSGKTTQLPKICLGAGRGTYGRIGCTQPRRVAALSVSRRIADELDATWGQEVGCKIRFSDETVPETRIKMMTDGVLLGEIQSDPELLEYDTIIIDEAHERSLNIDFLIGYLRLLIKRRKELKVVITSATIDTDMFARAFGNAPVIEVSGRLHPVEIRYLPIDEMCDNTEEYTYVDGTVEAVDQIMEESREGDILVFLPTEKDIHETRRRLDGRLHPCTDILPLFGRLTKTDQNKVFRPGSNRRIIIATNVAETSLTIPRIKYVIDPGLARISRYVARTQRLPIEPIAQSSAHQRAGRCGRVSGGICIRLYRESDLINRPKFTTPELLRSNLAEVILRMLSLKLGDINAFPFLIQPKPQAIKEGFQLLTELGAIDKDQQLTDQGQSMARLPVSPTVARMLLQAQQEGVLNEVLIIASAISIQDPRLRPIDQQQEADKEHKKFMDGASDFLTLLNIWKKFHKTFGRLQTQTAMRRFCRNHYLSYNRMREWHDIYVQLRRALRETDGFRSQTTVQVRKAHYDTIHRSLLSGLLSQIAEHKEGNIYTGTRRRTAMIFPGSSLFKPKRKRIDISSAEGNNQQEDNRSSSTWIFAAEMVETNRLYARTVAKFEPEWAAELGYHLCRPSYSEARWDKSSERVLIDEVLHLYGLQISRRSINYKNINPKEATRLFIQHALVKNDLRSSFDFIEHNRSIRQDAEIWLLQHRDAYRVDLDVTAFQFYEEQISRISSVADLNRFLKKTRSEKSNTLYMKFSDLTGVDVAERHRNDFPEYFSVEGERLPLKYACRPGQEDDGVTLSLPYEKVHLLVPEMLDWIIPGLLCEKIELLLRGLPRRKRKQLVPIPQTARIILAEINSATSSLTDVLTTYIERKYRIKIEPSDWSAKPMPDHLKTRVLLKGEDNRTVLSTRDPDRIRAEISDNRITVDSENWRRALEYWEQYDLRDWSIGDLPEKIDIGLSGSISLFAYLGLQADEDVVDLRLYRNQDEALEHTPIGLIRLF